MKNNSERSPAARGDTPKDQNPQQDAGQQIQNEPGAANAGPADPGKQEITGAEERPAYPQCLDVPPAIFREVSAKKEILEKEFDIPVTTEMEGYLTTMAVVRYELETEAEACGWAEGEARGRIAGRNELLYCEVMDGVISLPQAAQYAHISESEFEKNMHAFRSGRTAEVTGTTTPDAD